MLWNFLVIAGLRLCGIPLSLRLGKKQGIERQAVLRRLGKRGYVFVNGVLFLGWGLFAGITVSDYVSQRYFGIAHNRLTLTDIALLLLIGSICGVFFGMNDWSKSATPENAMGSTSKC
jgi:hypothetical protein